MLAIVSALPFSENKVKEKLPMEELNKANETLSKLAERDVRIIYRPQRQSLIMMTPRKGKTKKKRQLL